MVSEIIVILQCGKCYLMKCVYHKGVGNQSFLHGFLCKYLENREIRINTHTHTHTGYARQYTTNPLNYNGLEKYISTREAPFLQINYRSHTIPPPCRSRSERNFHVPGAMRHTASSRPHVPGTFCTIRTTNQ